MTNEQDALTKAEPTALAKPGAGDYRGKQNIDRDDITLPRIAIAQKTSPQIEPDKPEYIEGLKLFQLFNTLTNEIYGAGPLHFVIIRMDKRGMQFDANNAVVDFDVPLNDPRLEWTDGPDGRKKPEAVLFYDYIVIPIEGGVPGLPAVLSLKGTGIKVAKRLNGLMQLSAGPAWAVQYAVTASKGTSGSFTFGVYNIRPAGRASAEIQALADRTYTQLLGKRVETDRGHDEPATIDPDAVPF